LRGRSPRPLDNGAISYRRETLPEGNMTAALGYQDSNLD
jgi:hypothetical protein